MRNVLLRVAILSVVGPILISGCATQQELTTDASVPAATAPSVPLPAQAPVNGAHAVRTKPDIPPPTEIETRNGIQITQVALTAAGGLVDFRFKVLNAAKASKLFATPANVPVLMAEGEPPLMPPHHAMRGAKFGEGNILFILYPNVRGAIKHGAEVMVAVGDVRLGPVTVR